MQERVDIDDLSSLLALWFLGCTVKGQSEITILYLQSTVEWVYDGRCFVYHTFTYFLSNDERTTNLPVFGLRFVLVSVARASSGVGCENL